MKISNINTYIVDGKLPDNQWTEAKNFIFVQIVTDEGVVGWGEAYALTENERSIAQLIEEVGAHLIDTDPTKVRRFASYGYQRIAENRSGLHFYCALSALEMALWDITGKVNGLPVYELLGGICHEAIRLYANFWSEKNYSVEQIADKAIEFKEQGFTAVKIYPMRYSTLKAAEECVRKVRDAIGNDIDLMIDMSAHTDPVYSLQAALRFLPYDPYWIEEPVPSHDIDNLTLMTSQVPARIVTGERLAGKSAFHEILSRKAANILNPDIAACGGILTFLEISAMAEAQSVLVTPHNYNSMAVAQAAMLQVASLAPNCVIAEYFPFFQSVSDRLSISPLEIENGYARLPKGPGIGIELDMPSLEKFRATSYKARKVFSAP